MGIGGVEGPWFVVHKDLHSNTLYVAAKEDNDWLKSDECHVSRINWFSELPTVELSCFAKFRYRQKDHPVTIRFEDGTLIVKYAYPIASVHTRSGSRVLSRGCMSGVGESLKKHLGMGVRLKRE
jgi:tRNA-uridine 2-sulfurtransferase